VSWFFGPVVAELAGIRREIRRLTMSRRRPRLVVRFGRKEPNSMALVYGVSAGAPVDHDVVSRELTVAYGDATSGKTFDGTATDFGEIVVPQDSEVTLTLVDIDDAGNRSEPAVVTFTALDTIPPAKPGEFGVTLLREVPDEV
jgi:hypothetical protein